MIIEQRARDKHQNPDSLSKKTEFYERQEQRDRPEERQQPIGLKRDGLSFMDKKTYDSLPLMRWLDKSGEPIESRPELPTEDRETKIGKQTRMLMEILLKSELVKEK